MHRAVKMMRELAALAAVLASACTSPIVPLQPGATEGAEGSTSASPADASTSDPGTTTRPLGSTGVDGTATDAATDEGLDGGSFFTERDGGGVATECSIFAQDCPPGEKCMPYSSDGGPTWTATACFPIARDAVGYGETCEVEGSGVSGIDDCGAGMMCWNVDREGFGECAHFCIGGWKDPSCPIPDQYCLFGGRGLPLVCEPRCDPLAQDCAVEGEACYPNSDAWVCAYDGSGDGGTFGDGCEFINGCDPMHACLGPTAFTTCEGSAGCCSRLCDVLDGTSDAACAALDPAMSCQSWYREGEAPTGYDHVGVCAVPQ